MKTQGPLKLNWPCRCVSVILRVLNISDAQAMLTIVQYHNIILSISFFLHAMFLLTRKK